jgi:hypoxanthine phosphoribosyltransferase
MKAMQTFTSQSLAIQAVENPFSHPTALADLLVPHTERWRSSNDPQNTLILRYPASYASTVVALQKLLGKDKLLIPDVVDTDATVQPPSTSLPVIVRPPSPMAGASSVSDKTSPARPERSLTDSILSNEAEPEVKVQKDSMPDEAKHQSEQEVEQAWRDFSIEESDEEEYDTFDRMYMPGRGTSKIAGRQSSGYRKAMKWMGWTG